MNHFLLYRGPTTAAPFSADQWGTNLLGSAWFGEGVEKADVIWGVTSGGPNELRLVSRVEVEKVLHSTAETVKFLGDNTGPDVEHFVIGRASERVAVDINLGKVARRLTFAGAVKRLPAGFTRRNLQRLRRLTPESADLLERAWVNGYAPRPPQFVWTRDELLLALDLYLRLNKVLPDDSHPEVIALSRVLRQLPIHPTRHLDPTFRNPNGVSLKIANFRRIDQPGHGMSRGNQLERVVWDEWALDPDRLRRTAKWIMTSIGFSHAMEPWPPQDEEEAFPEGRIAYRFHVSRERNAALVRRKKSQALARDGQLRCEACAFVFCEKYGDLGVGFIECHHTVPVYTLRKESQTRLEDVALVCSNCHRMIHRSKARVTIKDLRELVKQTQLQRT